MTIKKIARGRRWRGFVTGGVADADLIREGFGWNVAGKFQSGLGFNDQEMAVFLGMSSRTLSRLRNGAGVLDKVASDRLYRIMRIVKLASDVFGNEVRALRWLRRPQFGLGGEVPLSLLDTEPGFEAVETLLQQIEYGVIS